MNLKELFPKYRIDWDEARTKRDMDPLMMQIRCQHGHIYIHDAENELLAVSTARSGPLANRIAKLPGTTILQDADDGMTIAFPLTMFKQIAKIVKPRTRRKLSPEQREANIARLAAARKNKNKS